jgi:hypothetical protein
MISNAELLHNFAIAKAKLAAAKIEELRWRMLVALHCFSGEIKLGTNWSDDGAVKMVAKVNVSLTKDKLTIHRVMSAFATEYPQDASNILDWEWKLSETAYHSLPDAAKAMLGDMLIIKPATPSVRLASDKDESL